MDGILIIDKPKGFTSFDTVAVVRKICKEKKCGHTGTLDPMATGVLTVLLGGATGFCNFLPNKDKAYIASLRLGTVTDTLDITGKIISQNRVDATAADFERAISGFTGEIIQTPPMYSAVSVNGRRLYDLARQGIEIERPERKVNIFRLDILEKDEIKGEYKIYVECSSGTYIRSLVSDAGEILGCGAVLTELRRVKANGFTVDNSVTLDALRAAAEGNNILRCVLPIDTVFIDYPEISVSAAQAKRFSNGGSLLVERLQDCKGNGLYRVYSPDHIFLGLGNIDGSEEMKTAKIYVPKG